MGGGREGLISYRALRGVHDRPDMRLDRLRNDKTLCCRQLDYHKCRGMIAQSQACRDSPDAKQIDRPRPLISTRPFTKDNGGKEMKRKRPPGQLTN